MALSNGIATWSNLPVGVHSITAQYDGTSDFLAAGSDATQIIVQAPTSTALGASNQSSSYGQTLTLTASISAGADAAGGTVNFMEGSFSWGSAVVDVTGQAVLSLSSLPAGAHLIAAQFGGGGHPAAAGARIPGKALAVQKKVVAAIKRSLNSK